MTFIMASKSKHRIRAAGTVIASMIQLIAKDYRLARPVDFAMINGTEDPLMPYQGGWGGMRQPKKSGEPDGRVIPVEDVIEVLVEANGIRGKPEVSSLGNRDPDDGCTNEVRTWTDPHSGRRVMLVKVQGGGHVVPGGRQYLPKGWIGPACQDFDHAEVMWAFFQSARPTQGEAAAAGPGQPRPRAANPAQEKQLRTRVAAMAEATRLGDLDMCLKLSDPATVKEHGREKVERFFQLAIWLVKVSQVGPDDHRVDEIAIAADGKSARVKTQIRKDGQWKRPSTQIWVLADGEWYYQGTAKF